MPIPFATIRLKGQQGTFGVISNTDGDFQIPLRYRERIDTVIVSCIGYTTKKVLMNRLTEDRIHVIRLDETTLKLQEVQILARKRQRLSASNIVKSAIENIEHNYPSSPVSYLAYYRDYQLRDNRYINLNEAIVEIFDEGFKTNDRQATKVALYDYKRNEKFDRDSITEVPYDNAKTKFIPGARLQPQGGNELVILRIHDAVRNHNVGSYSFVDVFDNNFVENHLFRLEKTIFLNETPLYEISFNSKESASGTTHIARGFIYIEHGNYAIHKLEYTTYELTKDKEKTLYDIQLEYSRGSSAMSLNYLSFNNFFNLLDPQNFKVEDITVDIGTNAVIVTLNKRPELKSVSNISNYTLIYKGKKYPISKVRLQKDANIVYLYPQSYLFTKRSSATEDLSIQFGNIFDTDGRRLNENTYIPVQQFREIFVQNITTASRIYSDATYVDRDVPLAESPKSNAGLHTPGYWMNTPLKSISESPYIESGRP